MPKSSIARCTPSFAEAVQSGDGSIGILHEHRLGDLEAHVGGIDTGAGEDRRHGVHDGGGLELAGRQVDSHLNGLSAGGLPGVELLTGLLEHPRTDRLDEPGVFGDADELDGRDEPRAGPSNAPWSGISPSTVVARRPAALPGTNCTSPMKSAIARVAGR